MAEENPFDSLHAGLKEYCAQLPGSYLNTNAFSYFESSKYSDAIIRCKGQEFKVHKVVLCAQSKYFSKAFDGDWKESANDAIELKEDEISIVEAMLNFMYLFDYGASGSDQARVSPMIFHVKVYSIADKYDVVALKSQAKEKFEKAARSCWNMEDFPPAISEVYSLTPATDRGLRDLVVEIVCTHIDALLVRQDFRNVLEETVGFAADVTQLIASTSTLKEYKCPHCSNRWKAMLSGGSTYYCVRCGSSRANWEQHVVTES